MKKIFTMNILVIIITAISLNPAYPQLADSPWSQYRYDPQRTGRSPYKGPEYPILKWKFDLLWEIYESDDVAWNTRI